jgi:hypothetical protein
MKVKSKGMNEKINFRIFLALMEVNLNILKKNIQELFRTNLSTK